MFEHILFYVFRLVDNHTGLFWISAAGFLVMAFAAGGMSDRQSATTWFRIQRLLFGLVVFVCVVNSLLFLIWAGCAFYDFHISGSRSEGAIVEKTITALAALLYSVDLIALAAVLLIVPSTRKHPMFTFLSIMTLTSSSLMLPFAALGTLWWWPRLETNYAIRNIVPHLVCVVVAMLWFGIQFCLAFLKERCVRTWLIAGLVALHLVSLALCIVSLRSF